MTDNQKRQKKLLEERQTKFLSRSIVKLEDIILNMKVRLLKAKQMKHLCEITIKIRIYK